MIGVNKVKRLFLDESLAEVKANLQDMLGKLLANEWTRFHADNPATNQALKAKIEENKTAIMLGLTYLNRYYDLKFGAQSFPDALRNCRTAAGAAVIELAKITGITPAGFTFKGR